MFHKSTASSATSPLVSPQTALHLAPRRPALSPASGIHPLANLVPVLSRRGSAFCAEAAVLVLVFGLLDYFMLKGRIELPWIAGALTCSVLLLALSVLIELTAQRWIKAHP